MADPKDAIALLTVRGKAMKDRTGELFDLMKEVICSAKFDNKTRALEILKVGCFAVRFFFFQGSMARSMFH